jgi:hypothetical protein
MSINAMVTTSEPKKPLDKYKYPIRINNRTYKVLTIGTVRGHEIYCHLLEVPDAGQSIGFRASQIVDFVLLDDVFESDDIEIIKRIIDFRVPSCHLPEIASEICINWLILERDGYSQTDVCRAIQTGIDLSILHYGYGGMWVGRTLHVY